MKRLLRKIKQNPLLAILIGLISFILIFIIIIPLCINWLYKQPASVKLFAADWGASDALAFYGTMLAAIATIAGVFISVKYAQSNYHTDKINAVRPYFALSYYHKRYHYNPFNDYFLSDPETLQENGDKYYYEETRTEKVYIIVEKDKIRFMDRLSKEQEEQLHHLGLEWKSDDNKVYQLQRHPIVSLPFDAENVGNGAAIDTRVAFYKKDGTQRAASVYTIKRDASFYFHIFCDDFSTLADSQYEIALDYYDIIGNHYRQNYPIYFDTVSKVTMDFSGKQVII